MKKKKSHNVKYLDFLQEIIIFSKNLFDLLLCVIIFILKEHLFLQDFNLIMTKFYIFMTYRIIISLKTSLLNFDLNKKNYLFFFNFFYANYFPRDFFHF